MTGVTTPPLPGFGSYSFPDPETGRPVYRRGASDRPAVILLHELPGMVPECVELGRTLADRDGYQVHMPLLFGKPGQQGGRADMARWLWCVRREMSLLARSEPGAIADWVSALAAEIVSGTGAERVAVIGMCLTGGVVLALVSDASVVAVVASQPSLPFPLTQAHARSFGVPYERVVEGAKDGAAVLAMRYAEDRKCPRARFERLAEAYGGQFPGQKGKIIDVRFGRLKVIEVPGQRLHALLTLDRHDYAVAAVRGFLAENLE